MNLYYKSWNLTREKVGNGTWLEYNFFSVNCSFYYMKTRWFMFFIKCRYDGAPYRVLQIGPLCIMFGKCGEWEDYEDE